MLICAPQRKPTTAEMNSAIQAVQKMRVAVRGFTCLNSSSRFFGGEEISDVVNASCRPVLGQTLKENSSVALARDAIVQQNQHAAIVKRTNQAAESLFQRNDGTWNLVFHKCIPAICSDGRNAR